MPVQMTEEEYQALLAASGRVDTGTHGFAHLQQNAQGEHNAAAAGHSGAAVVGTMILAASPTLRGWFLFFSILIGVFGWLTAQLGPLIYSGPRGPGLQCGFDQHGVQQICYPLPFDWEGLGAMIITVSVLMFCWWLKSVLVAWIGRAVYKDWTPEREPSRSQPKRTAAKHSRPRRQG